MVKTTNENKVQYVAPKMKEIEVRVRKGVLDGSQDYSGEDVDPQGGWSGNGGWVLQ